MGSMHMKKAVELANDKSSKLTAQIDINKLIATKEKSQESK